MGAVISLKRSAHQGGLPLSMRVGGPQSTSAWRSAVPAPFWSRRRSGCCAPTFGSLMKIRRSGSRSNWPSRETDAAHGHREALAPLHRLTFFERDLVARKKPSDRRQGEGRAMLGEKLPKLGQGDIRLGVHSTEDHRR